jgi:hypothetical protein
MSKTEKSYEKGQQGGYPMSRTKMRIGIGLAAVMFGVGLAVPAQASPTAAPVTSLSAVTGGGGGGGGDWRRGGGDWGGGGDWWGGHHRCWFWRHGHWQFKWWDNWCRWHFGHGGGGWHGGGGGHGGH